MQLLERVGRGVRLTEQARILVRHTDAVLERLELAVDEQAFAGLLIHDFDVVLGEGYAGEPGVAVPGVDVLGEEYAGEPGVAVPGVDEEDPLGCSPASAGAPPGIPPCGRSGRP